MGWKQPIDTDIYEWFGDDHLARDLFIHLLLKTQNTDMEHFKHYKNKPYKLCRGQVIFGRNEYAKRLRCSPSGTHKALNRLAKVYSKVTSKTTPDYTVITILNYDEIVSQRQAKKQQSNKQVTSKEQASDTLKIDKSEKNDKNIEDREINFRDSLNPFFEIYGREILKEFYDYWREPNKSRTKMKWEQQKTWDTSLRLKTWERNKDRWVR